MLLVIDLGNTNMVVGVYDGERLLGSWRLQTERGRTADEYGVLVRSLLRMDGLDESGIAGAVIASVVPALDSRLQRLVEQSFGVAPRFLTVENAGVEVLYENPQEVGADRLADAVAAIDRYGGPAIVVDLGTATTFNVITEENQYLGGLIAPGIEVSAGALIDRAAKLPRVEIRRPGALIGRSTRASLESGFFWGYVSLVDGVIERLRSEVGGAPHVIATGGWAETIAAESQQISITDSELTLRGLLLVARRLGVV